MLFDSHEHLNDNELYSNYRYFLNRAIEKGVKKMMVIGYDLESSKRAVQIAEENKGVCYAAIGLQPNEILKAGANDLNEIESMLNNPVVKAVGEIGLEYHYDDVPKEIQKEYFIKQLKLAEKYKKTVIIHSRDAAFDTLNILKEYKSKDIKGIMHCYSNSAEMVKEFIGVGMYISFGGPLTFKNAKTPKEAILEVPLDKLLLETDSPYLSPHPLRGTRNEPANIVLVAEEAAGLLNMDFEELSKQTYKNTLEVFDIDED